MLVNRYLETMTLSSGPAVNGMFEILPLQLAKDRSRECHE